MKNKNNKQKKYLIDTSVILDDPISLLTLYQNGENKLFINDVVLKELNGHKEDGINEKGFFAREFIRSVERGSEIEDQFPKKLKVKPKKEDFIYRFICVFEGHANNPVELYCINRDKYENPRDINDMKILDIAKDYKLNLLTNDISLKGISLSKGVVSETLKKDSVQKPEDILFNHSLIIEKEEDLPGVLQKISEAKSYSQFMLTLPNGNKKFYMPVNGVAKELKMDQQDFSEYRIAPINLEQKFLLRMLSEQGLKVAVTTGSTGSGKTLMVLNEAIRRVEDPNDPIEKIVYCRNTVTSNDKASELGFRKGDENQKLGYFALPLFGNINFILNNSISKKPMSLKDDYQDNKSRNSNEKASETELFMKQYNIEVVDLAHMRGITLSNTFVIFDEAQNSSNATLQLCGTRSGKNTMFVVLGDFRQVDHPYLSKNRNSLVSMLNIAKTDNYVGAIQLQKTIRSDVAAWFQDSFI